MNRTPPVFKTSKALTGFLQYKAAEALSPRTLEIYDDHLNKWIAYAGDPLVSKVKTADLRGYLAWLATEYKPHRITGNQDYRAVAPALSWPIMKAYTWGLQVVQPRGSCSTGPFASVACGPFCF